MDAPDAPALAEKSDPCPGVEIYFATLDGDAATITVWRIADGVREEVRGALRASVAGDFVVTDWEAPFGVEITYVGEIYDAGGASVSGAQASIMIDVQDVWFQDQVDPELSFSLRFAEDTAAWLLRGSVAQIARTRRTTKQFVFGRPRPFLQNFGLGAIESLAVSVLTETEQHMQTMLALAQVSPIVVRTPPAFASLPRVLSADVPRPIAEPFDQGNGDAFSHVWLLTLDEVEPVSKALIRPLVTWGDWEAAFPEADYTWTDVELLYSAGTWTDAVRNPPHA